MLRHLVRSVTHSPLLFARSLSLAVISLLVSYNAFAASVLSVEMDEMLQASELVIEGVVVEIESRSEASNPWKIHTYVTIKVIDIVKGSTDSEFITLSFLGGTVGDKTLDVGGMQVPKQGERGVYFIEAPTRLQVNPLYGWQQGHFLSEKDSSGVERMMTSSKKPIYDIDMHPPTAPKGLSDGVARGLTLKKAAVNRQQPLSVEEFKSTLKGMLRGEQ